MCWKYAGKVLGICGRPPESWVIRLAGEEAKTYFGNRSGGSCAFVAASREKWRRGGCHSQRSEFVYCAVKYALYCIQFDEGLDWIVEDEAAV
jgi:hypothetical protein